ncbi:hypothetical protein BJX61DRAFT_502737, partial [Aspergillus egyptiacus]
MCDSPAASMIRNWLQTTGSSSGQEGFPTGSDGPTEGASRGQGRGKYVSKACDECQRRKIKVRLHRFVQSRQELN